ncbi:MAG: hypothetical protein U0174_25175 [Polyangiaceae bacterium]
MRRFTIVYALCLVASVAPLAACAASADSEEQTDNAEGEIKKKVKPRGGNGAFDLAKPTWSTAGAVSSYAFDNRDVALDSRTEKVPGSYTLMTRVVGMDNSSGQTMGQLFDNVVITAGNVVTRTATGLRVRFDKPLTLGGSRYEMTPTNGGTAGWLATRGAWSRRADGVLLFVAPGKIQVRSSADNGPTDLVLPEGKLTEVVLPTAKLEVQLDAYDAAYPTPTTCAPPYVYGGAPGEQETREVRDQNGVPMTVAIVPHGTRTTVALRSYGIIKTIPTVAGQTSSFMLNRLEVDDVEVSTAGGGTQLVKGTYSVEYKDGANWRNLECGNFPTHSGIDIPDGTYRVTSRANSASGVVTHTEEVSFP